MLLHDFAFGNDWDKFERIAGLEFDSFPDLCSRELNRSIRRVDWAGMRETNLHVGVGLSVNHSENAKALDLIYY
jgi:hypothetical protein